MLILVVSVSCRSNNKINKSKSRPIQITGVDSLKFKNYYVLDFLANNNEKGKILITKNNQKPFSLERTFLKKRYHKYDLCDVIEFLPDDSDIFFRGHSILGEIYENGELLIDFSNDAEERYYRFCQEDRIKKIIKGKILSENEPLFGVSLMKKGTIIGALSNIHGDFELNLDTNEEFELIVNPCCTCYESTKIKIEENIFNIQIDCNCKKSKVIVTKKYFKKGVIKKKKNVIWLN